MDPMKQSHYLQLAQKAAAAAGRIQMQYFGERHNIETKSTAFDLVTHVDRECEEEILRILRKHFPDAMFLGEESFRSGDAIDLSGTWIIDPVDGTTNYAHNFPHFAVSIAYYENNEPQVGVVYDAFKKEMFTALAGRGAFLNNEQVAVSGTHTLSRALLATGFPVDVMASEENNLERFAHVLKSCHSVRRPGSAALDMAYLACGRLDGFWEIKLAPWDVAAGILLVQEAGGVVSDISGKPLVVGQRRIDIAGAGHETLHGELIRLLNEVGAPAGLG